MVDAHLRGRTSAAGTGDTRERFAMDDGTTSVSEGRTRPAPCRQRTSMRGQRAVPATNKCPRQPQPLPQRHLKIFGLCASRIDRPPLCPLCVFGVWACSWPNLGLVRAGCLCSPQRWGPKASTAYCNVAALWRHDGLRGDCVVVARSNELSSRRAGGDARALLTRLVRPRHTPAFSPALPAPYTGRRGPISAWRGQVSGQAGRPGSG